MYVKDVIASCKFRLKVLDISFFAHSAGGRHGASTQHVVEFMGVELLEVDVRVNHLFTHGIRHTDHFDAILGTLLGSDVAIGVAKECQHNTKI